MSINILDSIPKPVWITTDSDLAMYCQLWQAQDFIALDTEFMRTSTFYPKPGLVQVADNQDCYLIDPLTVTDWSPFAGLLDNLNVVKVFHACSEDLEVCHRLSGTTPNPVADTQIGAALGSLGGIMGFQRLVKAVLDLDIDKGETRSDWLHRPLREKQIEYAVADVFYLYQCYERLMTLLTDMGRLSWWQEDCARILSLGHISEDYSQQYRKVKLAWKLRPQEQYVLQQMAIWRERTARIWNVPRSQVVEDSVLWNIARYQPVHQGDLARAGMKTRTRERIGDQVLVLIAEALGADENQWPDALQKPLSPQESERLKLMKKEVTACAESIDIPADMLVKKKTLEALLRSGYPRGPYCLPEPLLGWRKDKIGDDLLLNLEQADISIE
ncbi:MAG: ribonuclease D [Glaciecola sp.]